MSIKPSKFYFGFLVVVLAVATQSCSVSQKPMPAATKPSMQTQPSPVESSTLFVPTTDIQNGSPTETPTPTIDITPSPTSPIVTVTAVNGDLSIRTGPDVSFDAIAKLKDGDTVTALARSILDGWVEISIPSQPGKTGWISIQTNYSVVNGNVLDLPRVDAVEWNVGSYLINCTPHQMLVQPGDILLQRVDNAPNNRVWFSPGTYSVYDLDVTGQPVAANLSVTEHRTFHILKDGNRKQWSCPSDTE